MTPGTEALLVVVGGFCALFVSFGWVNGKVIKFSRLDRLIVVQQLDFLKHIISMFCYLRILLLQSPGSLR